MTVILPTAFDSDEEIIIDDGMTEESCPDCGAKLRWRATKWAARAFLGCSKFPKCRWTSFRDKKLAKTRRSC